MTESKHTNPTNHIKPAKQVTFDGGTGVAHIAYRVNEICSIYPITPSSSMAELCDEWAAAGLENIWGQIPDVIELKAAQPAPHTAHCRPERSPPPSPHRRDCC